MAGVALVQRAEGGRPQCQAVGAQVGQAEVAAGGAVAPQHQHRAGRPLPTRGDDRALLPTACDIARCRAVNAGVLAATAPRQP